MKNFLFSNLINHVFVWIAYFAISWSFYNDYLPLNHIVVSPLKLFLFNCVYIGLFIPIPYLVLYLKKYFFAKQQYILFFIVVGVLFTVCSALFAVIDRLFLRNEPFEQAYTFRHLTARVVYLIILSLIIHWIKIQADYQKQKKQQAELERLKNEAELNMLLAQISPHFLFNVLNNLNSLIHTNTEKASKVVVKLSDLLRYVIYEGKKDKVSINHEIDYMQNYISLNTMKKRLEHKIIFNREIHFNVQVEPLIFINFIENAIKHGSLENDSDLITINLYADPKKVEFTCVNAVSTHASKDKTNGIGIDNIKSRLQVLYPNKHTLIIDSGVSEFKVNLTLAL